MSGSVSIELPLPRIPVNINTIADRLNVNVKALCDCTQSTFSNGCVLDGNGLSLDPRIFGRKFKVVTFLIARVWGGGAMHQRGLVYASV